MTNKDKIQAQHLKLLDNFLFNLNQNSDESSHKHTTVTAEAIKEYEKWKDNFTHDHTDNTYFISDLQEWIEASDLPELFLNQKAKI